MSGAGGSLIFAGYGGFASLSACSVCVSELSFSPLGPYQRMRCLFSSGG